MTRISPRLRLKDNHPTAQKLSKLFALADKLGISLSFYGSRAVVEDKDRDESLPPLYMEDIEDDDGVHDFPPCTDYKLVFDNPEYVAQQEREYKEREAKYEAEQKAAEAKRKADEELAQAKRANKLEEEELTLLRKLQDKYKDKVK